MATITLRLIIAFCLLNLAACGSSHHKEYGNVYQNGDPNFPPLYPDSYENADYKPTKTADN